MPLPNEHAARQKSPESYDKFRRSKPKGWPAGLSAIYGIKADGKTEIQSIRAKSAIWTVTKFRQWLKSNGFKSNIEAASKSMPVPKQSGLITRALSVQKVQDETRSIQVIASTDTIDGHGEIVEQSWQLERYLANPVVLFAHNSRELPIGKAQDVGVVDGKLKATIVFATEKANPKAEQVYQSFQEGTMRAVSVGFMPHDARMEKRNDKEILVLSDNELFEISTTPVPSNPEALAQLRARAMQTDMDSAADERGEEKTIAKEFDVNELEKAQAALKASEQELIAERSKVEALQERCVKLEEISNGHKKRADELANKLVEGELKELVGKKIIPAEVPNLIALAALDSELYEKQLEAIRAREDSSLLEEKSVMGQDPAPAKTDSGKPGESLVARVERRMSN